MLKKRYEAACNAYLKAFCKKYGFNYEPDMWVGGEVGSTIQIADFFFDMHNIIYLVDNDIPFDDMTDWYYYNLDAATYVFTGINLKSWFNNCPRKSSEELDAIVEKRKAIEKMKEELTQMCKDEQSY